MFPHPGNHPVCDPLRQGDQLAEHENAELQISFVGASALPEVNEAIAHDEHPDREKTT